MNTVSAHLKVITAAIIWGSIGVIVRQIKIPVPTIVFFRVIFASFTVFLFLAAKGKIRELSISKHRLLLPLMGAIVGFNWVSFFYALKLTSIANAVLVTYTAPVFIALLALIFLGEKLHFATFVSIALSLLGIVFILSPSSIRLVPQEVRGILWALLSAITYAVIVIIAKSILKDLAIGTVIFYESAIAALVLLPFAVKTLVVDSRTLLFLLILGIIHTALAGSLYLSGLRVLKTQSVGVLSYLDPLSATLFAILFLGEKPSLATLIGGLLILVAGINVTRIGRERD